MSNFENQHRGDLIKAGSRNEALESISRDGFSSNAGLNRFSDHNGGNIGHDSLPGLTLFDGAKRIAGAVTREGHSNAEGHGQYGKYSGGEHNNFPSHANGGSNRPSHTNEGGNYPSHANEGSNRPSHANEGGHYPSHANEGGHYPSRANEGGHYQSNVGGHGFPVRSQEQQQQQPVRNVSRFGGW